MASLFSLGINTVLMFLSLSQALDAKVIIFKKKRRKNYRRTKGHRQVFLKSIV
jgi:ribosomal protein L21